MSSTPPPIPPRPVNIKINGNRAAPVDTVSRANFQQRFHQTTLPPLPPPLHNSDVLLLPQRSTSKNQGPLSSASSSESLNDSLGKIYNKILFLILIFYIFISLFSTASIDLLQPRPVILPNGTNNHTRSINQAAR
jgi:hypothetical protein